MLTYPRYSDDHFEYRHVQLPKQMLKAIPKEYFDGSRGTLKLLWEDEWRALGITQVCVHLCASMKEQGADRDHRVWAGSTTKSTSPSRTFCSSSESRSIYPIRKTKLTDHRRPINYQPPVH